MMNGLAEVSPSGRGLARTIGSMFDRQAEII